MAVRRIGNTNINFTPTQDQTQLWNMIGRDAGLNYGIQPQENFWDNPIGNAVNGFGNNIANRAKAAENAIGTTLAAPISFIDTARENANIEERNKRFNDSLNDIARKYGYADRNDYWDKLDAAEQAGNTELLNKMKASGIDDELKAQAAANANEAKQAADNWRNYRENSYVGKKINQENGKFLGDSLLTLSTGADIAAMGMGLPMGIAANAIQGGVEGFANELSQNGGTFDLYADDPSRFFKEGANIKNWDNFDWGRAGQNALIGAASGAATAGLNKVLPGAKAGGLLKNVASSTGRGALSGAVGGAVGGGLGAFMNGQDVLQGTLSGAGQGAVSGGVSGAAMGTVNALGNKVIGKGLERAQARQQAGQDATLGDRAFNKIREIQTTGQRWTDSGENFNERLTNTLNSGKSKVGNWINGKPSKTLGTLGNVGNRIQDTGSIQNLLTKIADRADELDAVRKNNDSFNYLPDKSWSSDYDDFVEMMRNPEVVNRLERMGLATDVDRYNYQTGAAMAQVLREEGIVPNTPTTASGWAKKALKRAGEDLSNKGVGLSLKDVSDDDALIGADWDSQIKNRGSQKDQPFQVFSKIKDFNQLDDLAMRYGYTDFDEAPYEMQVRMVYETGQGDNGVDYKRFLDNNPVKIGSHPEYAAESSYGKDPYQRVYSVSGTDEQYTFASNDNAPRNVKQAAVDYAYETDGRVDPSELTDFYNQTRNVPNTDVEGMAMAIQAETDGRVDANELLDFVRAQDGATYGSTKAINFKGKETPTLQQISEYGYDPADVMGDPTTITADGRTYYKIGKNKWATRGGSGRGDLGGRYRDDQIAEIVANANDVNVNPKQVAIDNLGIKYQGPGGYKYRLKGEVSSSYPWGADINTEDDFNRFINDYGDKLRINDSGRADLTKEQGGWANGRGKRQGKYWTDTPTTAGGWLKKAGKRAGDDLRNKGVGLSIKDVAEDGTGPLGNRKEYPQMSGDQALADEYSKLLDDELNSGYVMRQPGGGSSPQYSAEDYVKHLNTPEAYQWRDKIRELTDKYSSLVNSEASPRIQSQTNAEVMDSIDEVTRLAAATNNRGIMRRTAEITNFIKNRPLGAERITTGTDYAPTKPTTNTNTVQLAEGLPAYNDTDRAEFSYRYDTDKRLQKAVNNVTNDLISEMGWEPDLSDFVKEPDLYDDIRNEYARLGGKLIQEGQSVSPFGGTDGADHVNLRFNKEGTVRWSDMPSGVNGGYSQKFYDPDLDYSSVGDGIVLNNGGRGKNRQYYTYDRNGNRVNLIEGGQDVYGSTKFVRQPKVNIETPEMIELVNNARSSASPSTLGGWLKKAGKRAAEDISKTNLGNRIQDVGGEYSDDINNMFVNRNDMLDTTAESPETELYRQLTGNSGNNGSTAQTPLTAANTGDSWDNLAREYGYNTYNDAIRAFAAANPNTPISAGAVTTWLDANEGNYNPNRVQITQNATMPTEIQEAEIVPSKTSRETKLKYAQGKELLAQYGAVDQPMARATKAPETFQKLAEMGFTKPGDVEKISNAITGSNGAVSKLTKSVIASAKPVNTFDGETAGQTMDDFINNSIEHNMLSGTNQGKAVKRGIDAYLRSLPSHADGSITMEDSAADAFKVVQGLEARAAELEGRGGSTYHRATTEDVHQAAVLKDVANLLKDRIYAGANVKAALTPEVAQELKAFDPKNATWAKTVDDFVSSAKTAQDLRSFQKPFVRANRYIDNQYVQAATAGGRMAASAGELPAILPTTKAGVIKQVVNNVWNSNPAHRARAAAYGKLAENAASNAPQTQTTAQPAASNPQTAVYDLLNRNNTLNVIGRNIGEKTGEEQRPIENYLQEASAESGYMPPLAATTSTAGSLEDLANTGATTTTTPTTLADSLGGGTSSSFTGQFSSTGNDQVDLLGRAMELAMAADDADAFATLYGMYNNALSSLEKSSSDLSAAQQTQLAKFDSADDAINELEALYNQAGGGKGPIAGNLQSVAGDWGWDSGARTYNQMAEGLVNQIAQAIGKTDSLNTEGEVQRALKLVPSLTDDAQTAQNKLRTLREMLAQTKANYYGAYGV